MSLRTMLESVGTLYRPTIGRDAAMGVTVDPYAVILQDVPCSVQQANASITLMYAQRNALVTTTVYFDQDPGAQANDQFRATDRYGNVTYYNVTGQSKAVGRGMCPWMMPCEAITEPV